MSAKISDVISKYVDPQEPVGPLGDLVQMTIKFPEELKLMLETMALYYGVKKSPFLNELVIAAIQEAWEKSEKIIDTDLLHDHYEDVQNLLSECISKSKPEEETDV